MADADSRTIGRYEIRRELGRGAMGVVFEAWDPLLERTVALKTIEVASATSLEELLAFEERFFAEARVAARLTHPGIVTVHDVGRAPDTGLLFIAFERLEGRTLADRLLGEQRLSWPEALRVTARVAEALHYAHGRGVVHRDIKPANIMMLASGEPKILDFGIARTDTARIALTVAGQSIGTPLYSSPEQAQGEAADARSDLFSLGAVAYALLTGEAAFGADSFTGVLARVVHEHPAAPSTLVPGLPPGVDRVLARALAKAPSERYQDGASLAEDVEDVLAGRSPRHAGGEAPAALSPAGVAAPGPAAAHEMAAARLPSAGPAPPRTSRWRRRRLLALGAAVLAVAGLTAWWSRSPAAERRADAAASPPGAEPRSWLQVETEPLPPGSRLRLWVDRELVADLRPNDRGVDPAREDRFAAVGGAIAMSPGAHDVELELVRGGKRLVERVRGEFRPGARRRLRAKVGGLLRKRLVLEWR